LFADKNEQHTFSKFIQRGVKRSFVQGTPISIIKTTAVYIQQLSTSENTAVGYITGYDIYDLLRKIKNICNYEVILSDHLQIINN